jgi:uncharacterized protein (TIGR02246 family)
MSAQRHAIALSSICTAWAGAWNQHSIDALARLVCPDVDFVTVAGVWLRGVDEFRKHHAEIHRSQMKESTWTNVAQQFRQLSEDLFLAHLEWTIVGDRDLYGAPRPPRLGIFTWLAVAGPSTWTIQAAHNTNLRDGLRHRSATKPFSAREMKL